MGCWYETCAFSGLPIPPHDRALLFIIEPGMRLGGAGAGFSYPVGNWRPSCLPFHGKYNDDRGTLDFDKGPPAHWQWTADILADLKLQWKEHPEDDEMGTWEPLTPAYSYSKFFEKIERGYVRGFGHRTHKGHGMIEIGQMLVREDVWNVLLGLSMNFGWKPAQTREANQRFAREYIDYVLGAEPKTLDSFFAIEHYFEDKREQSSLFHTIFHPGEGGPSFTRYRIWLTRAIADKEINPEVALSILNEIGDVGHVNSMLYTLRRAWGPQPGKGSQDIGWGMHAEFARKVGEIATREKAKADEEYGGDSEEPVGNE